ncbi:MAG: hypothetical protein QNJ45_28485 [Ardenticatenaceae bacterium]|nr:hypothetical protein [Ardenticatenaceae bacterium]
MNRQEELQEQLNIYLDSLPLPGRNLTAYDVEKGQFGKQAVLKGQAESVSMLLDMLEHPDFVIKDACYDLILEIGTQTKKVLFGEFGKRGPIVDIWIATMLVHLGDDRATDRLWVLIEHPSRDVRHLTALALAFQHVDLLTPLEKRKLYPILVDALNNEKRIEGAPFSIAGSALGCLTQISGVNFLSPPQKIHFFNYELFLYPPPTHPFPFAADFITTAPIEERDLIRQRAAKWLAGQLAP